MSSRVIQGFFVGDRPALPSPSPSVQRPALAGQTRDSAGPHRPSFPGAAATPLQRHVAPGRPQLVHAPAAPAPPMPRGGGPAATVQPFGGVRSFAVNPAEIGLVHSGGTPLPAALLAKMEAAFATDFSGVRVHIGPQAQRIGALAFTTGNDLYFAPGQYQPDHVRGQQLIGHELAHVVQQRQGRVRGGAAGVTVVQDRALEMEADRLGMRAAAMQRPIGAPLQRSPAHSPPAGGDAVQPSMSWAAGLGALGVVGGYALAGGFGFAAAGLGIAGALVGRWYGAPGPVVAPGPVAVAAPLNLGTVARAINGLHDYNDIATLAVARRTDGTHAIYTQRGYRATRECAEVLEQHGLPAIMPIVEAAEEADHNMHAEMLAVSESFAGNHPMPVRIGASRDICALCALVLNHLGIAMDSPVGAMPRNWCSPYYFNNMAEPPGVPRSRRNNRNY